MSDLPDPSPRLRADRRDPVILIGLAPRPSAGGAHLLRTLRATAAPPPARLARDDRRPPASLAGLPLGLLLSAALVSFVVLLVVAASRLS